VREERTNQGIAQETLAHMAGIERSHMGKIERGEHVPTLPLILKIARALKCSSAHLMTLTEAKLAESAHPRIEAGPHSGRMPTRDRRSCPKG